LGLVSMLIFGLVCFVIYGQTEGRAIAVRARGGSCITWPRVMRLVLCISLLATFTTSAAAALCLQINHHALVATAASPVAMELTGEDSRPTSLLTAAGPEGAPLRACCHPQISPAVITAYGRALPPHEALALIAQAKPLRAITVHSSPGLFDPAREKPGHLTPSLTALSISRT